MLREIDWKKTKDLDLSKYLLRIWQIRCLFNMLLLSLVEGRLSSRSPLHLGEKEDVVVVEAEEVVVVHVEVVNLQVVMVVMVVTVVMVVVMEIIMVVTEVVMVVITVTVLVMEAVMEVMVEDMVNKLHVVKEEDRDTHLIKDHHLFRRKALLMLMKL